MTLSEKVELLMKKKKGGAFLFLLSFQNGGVVYLIHCHSPH